jgi:hypothetical protein
MMKNFVWDIVANLSDFPLRLSSPRYSFNE